MFNSSANKLLFDLVKSKQSYIFFSLIFSLISTFLNILGTILLIPILYTLFNQKLPASFYSQVLFTNYFYNLLNQNSLEYQLVIMITSIAAIIIVKNIFNYFNVIINFKHTQYLVYQLKIKGLELLTKVNLDYYQKNKIEDISGKLNRDVNRVVIAAKSIQKILTLSLIILILTIILLVISWQLTLVTLISISSLIFINVWLASQVRTRKIFASEKSQPYQLQIIELLTGIRLIKTVANESAVFKAIAQSQLAKDQLQWQTQLISAAINPLTEIGGMVVMLILIFTSYYLYSQSALENIPLLLIYSIIIWRLLPFIRQFNSARLQLINTNSSVEIVANFITEMNKTISPSGNIPVSHLQTGIEFKEVTFAYPRQAQIILDKISFKIPHGQTIALVGLSEIKQSIIADLLSRLYEPIAGQILLDHVNLQKYNTPSLRKAIAIISSDTFLFNKSLADNIAFGATNVSQADIEHAAKKARIFQFINQLPSGFATEVGRGILLSKEQKLRISIARAFLRNPEILILDEPAASFTTNSLTSESMIQIIELLCRQRTTLIMTQQLNLAKQADQIIVFNQSRVKEIGTHEQLLRRGTIYPRLYSMQFKINQQSHQLKLTQKIARKLAQQKNNHLSLEIHRLFNTLLNRLELISTGLFNNESEQNKMLDESYQSAKDILLSLKEYESKLSRESNNTD